MRCLASVRVWSADSWAARTRFTTMAAGQAPGVSRDAIGGGVAVGCCGTRAQSARFCGVSGEPAGERALSLCHVAKRRWAWSFANAAISCRGRWEANPDDPVHVTRSRGDNNAHGARPTAVELRSTVKSVQSMPLPTARRREAGTASLSATLSRARASVGVLGRSVIHARLGSTRRLSRFTAVHVRSGIDGAAGRARALAPTQCACDVQKTACRGRACGTHMLRGLRL
jgi:hypothetical protein